MIRKMVAMLLAALLVATCLTTLAENRANAETGIPTLELTSVPNLGETKDVEGRVFLAGLDPSEYVIIAIVDGKWPKPFFDSYQNPLFYSGSGDYATFSFSVTTGGQDTSFNTFMLYLCEAALFENVEASKITDSFVSSRCVLEMNVNKTEFNAQSEESQSMPEVAADFYVFPVYDDVLLHYGDVAFMGSQNNGDDGSMTIDSNCTENPYSGESCIQITYTPPAMNHWAGMMWLSGAGNYPPNPPVDGVDTAQARQLTFYARGSGTTKFFIENASKQQVTLKVTLTPDWEPYVLDVPSDWDQVCVGFGFASSGTSGDSVIYLDDILYTE